MPGPEILTLALPRSLASMNSIGYIALAVLRGALPRRLKLLSSRTFIHTTGRRWSVFSIVWPRNSVMCKGQLKVLQNLLPASSGVERGGGGASAPGPGQLWGPGPSWVFLFCFYRKSVGDPGFWYGGSHLKENWPRYARHDLIGTILYTHSNTHTK